MARKTRYILLSVAMIAFLASCTPVAAATMYDATVNVGMFGYYAVYGSVTKGLTLTIQIEVTSGNDITLYILDETNFNKYNGSQSFSYYDCWPNYVSGTDTWQAPSTQTYYFVLDNKDSFSPTAVHLKITYGTAGDVVTGAFDLFSSLLPIIAIIIVVGIVVVVAVIYAVKKQRT